MGGCYVETSNLDGEKNLNPRSAPQQTMFMNNMASFYGVSGVLRCDAPNRQLYNFSGTLTLTAPSRDPSARGARAGAQAPPPPIPRRDGRVWRHDSDCVWGRHRGEPGLAAGDRRCVAGSGRDGRPAPGTAGEMLEQIYARLGP